MESHRFNSIAAKATSIPISNTDMSYVWYDTWRSDASKRVGYFVRIEIEMDIGIFLQDRKKDRDRLL